MDEVKYGEILEPLDDKAESRREKRVREKFWATAKKAARQVPLMEDVVAAYYCAFDPNTPTRVRGILLGALAYFVLPLDALPDFIAGFGFTDDVAVLTAVFTTLRSHITPAHKEAAKKALAEHDLDDEAGGAQSS